jgi:hypothetical protein
LVHVRVNTCGQGGVDTPCVNTLFTVSTANLTRPRPDCRASAQGSVQRACDCKPHASSPHRLAPLPRAPSLTVLSDLLVVASLPGPIQVPSRLAAALPFLSVLGGGLPMATPHDLPSASLALLTLGPHPSLHSSCPSLPRCSSLFSPSGVLFSVPLLILHWIHSSDPFACGMECGRTSLPSLVSPLCSRVSSLSHSSPPQLSSPSYFEECGGALRH